MPIEDFIVKDELGKGSFGAVFKAIRKEDEAIYAMKQVTIHLDLDQASKAQRKRQKKCTQLNKISSFHLTS